MTVPQPQAHAPNTLRPPNRFITEHTPAGLAIFNSDIPPTTPAQTIPTGDTLYLNYATNQFPLDLHQDLPTYQHFMTNPPGFTIPGGTVLCTIDLAPGSTSPLHRTRSLDYAVVVEGSVELKLDSGEVRTLQRGDVVVQRGTKHQWRNVSEVQWARVLFVVQESKAVVVNGEVLGEEVEG
ncbi:hypothetical protein BO94DRAFT_530768 [Aspergillus sclerotioniger CBS 115572]|uniref:Cupin type-2 domain-containing protein n=1 Tax=Aspergillus sclerotioniger CBS 115572 TaxID=1450535 RepID=A0A317XE85_9EURO|nr:hypothetical protein BO94DRAFT_530768 [Aspergillus sclerotioniger CBS 115572]PWY96072.1 hypothetical protein BO94DRAFT_530768 [Aspergillus sclerotioniger CBS 115572]